MPASSDVPVTVNGWSFEVNTFLYGNWIDEFPLQVLRQTYRVEGLEYHIIGRLTDDELDNVKECFRDSATVKRKFKRLL